METMLDPVSIRFSQGNIGEHFKDEPEVSIFETFEKIRDGMQKREVPMMHVVRRQDGSLVTLDNRRLAVYKMARHAGKCGTVKVQLVPLEEVKHELRHKSDSKVEGLSVTVRGPALSDGQLQHRADTGGHWSSEQLSAISRGIVDFEAVVKGVLGNSAKLMKAGSFMKATDVAGESDTDVMVFGSGPISKGQWDSIVEGIQRRGYHVKSTNPRCIHVEVKTCLVTIEFDVVAQQRQGYPPNKEPENPFRDNRVPAHAVRNIKMDFAESGEKGFSGNDIEQAVLSEQKKLHTPGLGKLIDAVKASLKSDRLQMKKRPRSAARENNASEGTTDWSKAIGEGRFRKVFKGEYTVGLRAGQANVSKVFKDGTEAMRIPSLIRMCPRARKLLRWQMLSTSRRSLRRLFRYAKQQSGIGRRASSACWWNPSLPTLRTSIRTVVGKIQVNGPRPCRVLATSLTIIPKEMFSFVIFKGRLRVMQWC